MRIHYEATDAGLYDLLVDGQKQVDWVWADDTTGEYELFVTELPWRGGGKIVDTDNSTGFQTLKQHGKVEFKRNAMPDPDPSYVERGSKAEQEAWSNMWGGFPGYCSPLQSINNLGDAIVGFAGGQENFPTLGAIRAITCDDTWEEKQQRSSLEEHNQYLQETWQQLSPAVQQFISERVDTEPVWPPIVSFDEWRKQRRSQFQKSVTFTGWDGEVWDCSHEGEWQGQVRFLDTRVTGGFLELEMEPLHWEKVNGEEPFQATLQVYSPGISWSHEWEDDGRCFRSFTLTSYCTDYEECGLQLFQWLDSLNVRIRQEVGLPV